MKKYQATLDQMLTMVIHKFGFEHQKTIAFATIMNKYYYQANADNLATMEKIFKNYVKNA